MTKNNKPDWDNYFMMLADVVKKRADCLRRQVGCVIVKDRRIIATGYNGTPKNVKNCTEGGCTRCTKRSRGELRRGENEESCICIHAEQNAIIQAAYLGVSTDKSEVYSTSNPCSSCAKMLINAGITVLVTKKDHHDAEGIKLLKSVGVKVRLY